MTKRSSFVIPLDLADVAVIVDISIAPHEIYWQHSAPVADLGRIELYASRQG